VKTGYRVVEIFRTVQGEGSLVGVPMIFVRLAGCNLACAWCDTDHDNGLGPMPIDQIVDEVRALAEGTTIKHLCITGGEPTLYALESMVQQFKGQGWFVAIETNGTREFRPDEWPDLLTVSPKWPPGIDGLRQRTCDEIKIPITEGTPSDEQITELVAVCTADHWFLQPVDGVRLKENANRCLTLASKRQGFRISGQMHKRLGLL